MAGLHMDCVEFDRIGAEDEIEEEEGVEVRHVRLSDTEAQDILHEGDINDSENQEVVEGEVKLEENDLHMAVIVQSEDGLTLDPSMLASGATQYVQLGSSGESLSLLTDDSQFLSGQLIQLSDGTTAVVQRGFQVVQLSDGTSALLPSGLFTDGEMDGTLEQIGEQMEEDEDEDPKNHIYTRQTVNMNGDFVDHDMSGNGCQSAGDMSVGGEESVMVQLANAGGRMSMAKTFKCSFDRCGRQYTTHHHLKVHMRSHTGDRPYPCDFEGCSKAFATGYGLKSHRRIHTGEKPYRCVSELCDKAFKTSGDLQKHMRTHTGERPFTCPYEGCKRSFTTSNILKVHIRTHTGERPFTCTEKGCGKTFASATNYKNHIRIHSGEKPYECSVAGCGKRFTEYSSLYKHHVVHTHTKPYPCETCGKTYRQTSTLAMHKRMAHGEDPVDDGEYVRVLVQSSTSKQPTTFRLTTEDGPRGPDDTDGNLIIDTSDTHQVSLAGASSNLLQQMALDGTESGSHVFVITDPSQIEAIQRISNQGN